ncbi:MAG: class I SAM-dependent methyltransferase [Gammaproteobacteria bacterium]|nr:class I SAM-dependent methyltransferase [Gammaproteobacteria bacterium]
MRRTPEPAELMDDPAQARAYADADFDASNALFVALFGRLHPGGFRGRALDLGCGPGDIPIRLARAHPDAAIDAVDGAEAMLAIARRAAAAEPQVAARLRWLRAIVPDPALETGAYDAVLSNSLLHHVGDPVGLWRTVRDAARPGAAVLAMDLARPADEGEVERLLALHAVGAPDLVLRDFRASLHAAYRVEEVREQLAAAGLAGLEVAMVSDRHLAVYGRLPAG